jgi:hypothetical protein
MTRAAATLTAVACLALLAGCGGGGGDKGGGDGKVTVETYASSVCTALTTWRRSLLDASTSLMQKTQTGSLKKVRSLFVSFYGGAIQQTDTMLAQVDAAGVPDLQNGDEVVKAMSAELGVYRPILVEARTKARNLPVNDESLFAPQAQSLGTRFQIQLNGLATLFDAIDQKVGAPDLVEAAVADSTCRELTT